MRSSAPRSSRISSMIARYSRSSWRVVPSTGTSSRCSATSTMRRPAASVWAAPATPRAAPERATARPPPGRRMWSVTSAIVPTLANSPSWRGTSSTRSSSPTRTGSVTSMVGKTTVSSNGTSRSDVMACGFTFCSNLPLVGGYRVPRSARARLRLSRRHPQSAIQPDDLAVEHRVLDDVHRQRGVLVRAPEPRRERDLAAEGVAGLLGQAGEQRRVEQAGGDRADADPVAGEVAGGGQRHPHDSALGGAVGDLADLAVVGGDRGGVDADAALALFVGLVGEHRVGGEPQDVEGADEVDADDRVEGLEGVRAVAPGDLLGPADARAADGDPQAGDRVDRRLDLLGVGDVGGDELRADRLGGLGSALGVQVGDRDVRAGRAQRAGGSRAQARGAAGDQRIGSFYVHRGNLTEPNHPAWARALRDHV